jgi:Cof subfamily protein (haloacid dehalogenase superfamily)
MTTLSCSSGRNATARHRQMQPGWWGPVTLRQHPVPIRPGSTLPSSPKALQTATDLPVRAADPGAQRSSIRQRFCHAGRVLPRLIATDLDGTLLAPDATVSPRTRAALAAAQARGIQIVVCTARPVRWMRGLAEEGGIDGVAVCANGAVLWDLGAETLVGSFPIPRETASEVVARLRALMPGGAWAIETVDHFGHEPGYRVRWPVPDDATVDHIEVLLATPPVKLLMRPDREHDAQAFAERARAEVAELVELTYSDASASLLEMSATGVSKGSGLASLCAARGIEPAQTIAFGDMPNDLPMLTWAGRSYAMANGHPEVIAAADETAPPNHEDGVAVVIERLLDDA